MLDLTVKQKKVLVTAGVTAAVYLCFKYFLPLVLPFLIAYLIALFLRPTACWLEKKLRFTVRKKQVSLPVGLIGGVELTLILILFGAGCFYGGRRLFMEANQLINAIPGWIHSFDEWLTGLCHWAELFCRLREGSLVELMREMLLGAARAFKNVTMPNLVVNSVAVFAFFVKILIFTVVLFIASILSLQEMDELRRRRQTSVFRKEFALLGRRLAMTGSAWLKTQAVLLFLTVCLCILTLIAIKNPYYIIAGIGIGLLDALPIFGTGTVLIPWSIVLFMQRLWGPGFALFGLYLACYFIREFLEAKLMGGRMGLSPLETLMSIYVGLELFGLLGVILGPVGLMLIEDLVEEYSGEIGEPGQGSGKLGEGGSLTSQGEEHKITEK